MKTGAVNYAQAYAERKQVANMVGDYASTIARAYRDVRRGNFSNAAKTLGLKKPPKQIAKSVPGKWLELQYGWKPLLSDVYGSVADLGSRTRDSWIVTSKETAMERVDVSKDFDYTWTRPRVTCQGFESCMVRIDAVPDNDPLLVFASSGITNPALLAWELLPYSFVVDWFLPIGDYLNSLDALLGYTEAYSSISNFSKLKWSCTQSDPTFNVTSWGENYKIEEWYEGHREEVYLQRSGSAGVPLPSHPRFKDPISLGHMANGLSLLAQAFGR
jgi:hypothetical protein